MPELRPFFSFFGSKWQLAQKYPQPKHETIIEPFAGSAGYSLRYPERNVILVEKDPLVAELWRWLVEDATEELILSLPRLKKGELISDHHMPEQARWLMGFWVHQAGGSPGNRVTEQGVSRQRHERVARQLRHIRHWRVINCEYEDAPDVVGTWFIDPPYQIAGQLYRYGPAQIDYKALADWCRSRAGQVIACENAGATWLPFEFLSVQRGTQARGGSQHISVEVVWTR